MEITAIIIDDELASRETLAGYLKKYCPKVKLLGMAENVIEGEKLIQQTNPDLVYLDIEMPFGNGFDLLEKFPEATFETIFVTAFSNYAIQALNLSAAYYLLKPINIDDLIKATEKVIQERAEKQEYSRTSLLLNNLKQSEKKDQKLALPTMEGFEVVQVKDIIYCKAEDNFSNIFFKDGSKALICRTLKHYQNVLDPFGFCRVHKSYVVNLHEVQKFIKGKGGSVVMSNGDELDVSVNKKKDFLEKFQQHLVK